MNTELTRKDIVDYIEAVETLCASEVMNDEVDPPFAAKAPLKQLICPLYFDLAYLDRLEWLKGLQHLTAMAIAEGDYSDIGSMESDLEQALSVSSTYRYFDQKVFENEILMDSDAFTLNKLDKDEVNQRLMSSSFILELKKNLTQPQFDMCAEKYFSAKYSEWPKAKYSFFDKNSPLNIEYNFSVLMFYYGVAKALLDYSNDCLAVGIDIAYQKELNIELQKSILALDTVIVPINNLFEK
ncbi:MAG: hypothetical protein Q7U16_05165 [Agitococcus sp.]|nr:hypothetical protein [Agitococcus sp.]